MAQVLWFLCQILSVRAWGGLHVCISVWQSAHTCNCSQRPLVWDPQRAGVTGSCEPSYLGAWNQTQFSCKSDVHLATASFPGPGVLFDEPQPYNHGEHTCQNPIWQDQEWTMLHTTGKGDVLVHLIWQMYQPSGGLRVRWERLHLCGYRCTRERHLPIYSAVHWIQR